MNKHTLQIEIRKQTSPMHDSPGSPRKHVLLNTSLPTGSPTFQRAMKGFKPSAEDKSCQSSKNKIEFIEEKLKATKSNNRVRSASGRRKPFLSETRAAVCQFLVRKSSPDGLLDADASDTLQEIRDQLGSLNVKEPNLSAFPRKSILKNRRRSIDDLDVGTKKGLSMYLKSRQNQSVLLQEKVHFT